MSSTSSTDVLTSSATSTSSISSPPPSSTPPPPPPPSPPGPPYPPTTAQLGLTPSPVPDIPVSAVLLLLFLLALSLHLAILARNRRRGAVVFPFSALLAVFCGARAVALCLRCAWAVHPRDGRVAIAAQIFTAAGVLLVFVVDLVLAVRVVRGWHPGIGWGRAVGGGLKALVGCAAAVLVMVVTVTVHEFFVVPGAHARVVDRRVQLFCAAFLAVYAFLPVAVVGVAVAVPRGEAFDRFGEGTWRAKIALLLSGATLLTLGAVMRAVAAFVTRPLEDPGWFHSKASYYCFNFVVELVVVFAYGILRLDRRFHVPTGSSAPGDYSRGKPVEEKWGSTGDEERRGGGDGESTQGVLLPASEPAEERSSEKSTEGSLRLMPSEAASQPSIPVTASSMYSPRPSDSSLVLNEDVAWMHWAMRGLYGDDVDEDKEGRGEAEERDWLPRLNLAGRGELSKRSSAEQQKPGSISPWSV